MHILSSAVCSTADIFERQGLKMGMGFEARAAHPIQTKSEYPHAVNQKCVQVWKEPVCLRHKIL